MKTCLLLNLLLALYESIYGIASIDNYLAAFANS